MVRARLSGFLLRVLSCGRRARSDVPRHMSEVIGGKVDLLKKGITGASGGIRIYEEA